ncbi:GAF domain-containing protein [Cryptosporangium aurantiacum]|uniref:Sensor-like histidine kinase SenX3 n=1 Tax=Cryptosporangium aurantiacum TaxID=134849 RepID=A0A1M7RKR9_9ACTN|nr:GAF domain-containing protein [Cryptosporangium aurantiacum]SHN46759.1 PAS domain S-box-containing protein [Cryptosporangium aurantiacum]
MIVEDAGVLADPVRLAAVDQARRVLPALPMPLEGIARLAARLLDAPIGLITLVGDETEHFAGAFGAPAALIAGGQASLAYSVCKYIVCADAPVRGRDMAADDDPRIRNHPLTSEYGVRAFLGVPLRDAQDRPVGSVSVMDTRPRDWCDAELSTLVEIAMLVGGVPGRPPGPGTVVLTDLDTVEVLDAITEAFLTLDVDATVTGWNTAATELFGFTAAEACGRPVDSLLAAEYEGRPLRELVAGLLTGQIGGPLTGPLTFRTRNHRQVHARARITMLHGTGGAVVCVFLTDLTAQVLAARAAADAAEAVRAASDEAEAARAAAAEADAEADSQRSFAEALLDSLGEGVVAVDAEGRAVVFNRALRELHGLPDDVSPDEAQAATLPRLHSPDGSPLSPGELAAARALNGHTVRDTVILVRQPDRPDRYMRASAQPVRGRDDRLMGAVITVQDITQRLRAERFRDCQLTVASVLLRPDALTELAPSIAQTIGKALGWPYISLRLVDQATDTLVRLAHWSAPGYDLEGMLPDRIPRTAHLIPAHVWATGQAVWEPDLAHSAWLTEPDARARARVYAQRGLHAALSVPVRDGETVLGVLTCFAGTATDDDEFLVTGLLTDVATQIGQFLARRRAEELTAELARARADFTALIGHDMRTPLTTIATYAQLLLEDPVARPDTDLRLLDGIDRNARTLRELVDGLLDLAALEAGHHTLDTRSVDLSAMIGRACEAAEPSCTAVTLDRQLCPGVHVTGDPDRLRQLSEKLLSTAVAATPPGGTIEVAVDRVDGAAQLRITHPGCLDGEAFDRFSQANATGVGNADAATGMGLLLSRVIAERHGGTLTVAHDQETTSLTVRLRQPETAATTSEPDGDMRGHDRPR